MAGDVGSRARNKFEERGLDKGGQVLSRGSRKGIVGNSRQRFLFSSQAGYGFNGSIDRPIFREKHFSYEEFEVGEFTMPVTNICLRLVFLPPSFNLFVLNVSLVKYLRIFILFCFNLLIPILFRFPHFLLPLILIVFPFYSHSQKWLNIYHCNLFLSLIFLSLHVLIFSFPLNELLNSSSHFIFLRGGG